MALNSVPCPSCGLCPNPSALTEFARAAGIAGKALARLKASRGRLSTEQRFNLTLAITTVAGLETLFLEEAARQRQE